MAAPFEIYNTLSRTVEPFKPLVEGEVSLYVCGMTVYDHCHVGHARAMIVFDTFVRYLRHRGWTVRFVRNFTDVDDKIIVRAAKTDEDPLALAQRFIDSFHRDMDGLGLLTPDSEPRVSTSIDSIVALIKRLVDAGHAYEAEGSVWFDVATDTEYGKLSNQKVDELRNPDDFAGKRAATDFALWKAAKAGEPSWPSPFGAGRPGWHIECSAMCFAELGATIDIHGGGLDLVFPHHENEIAQSECGNKAPFARYWMHNGMLTMQTGQKMGKSLGNVHNIHKALEAFPAEAIRLYYLQNQYRSPLPWGDSALPEALAMLSRLYDAKEKAAAMQGDEDPEAVVKQLGPDAKAVWELGSSFEARFYEAMDHDFNTAKAIGYAFELARAVNRFANHKKAIKRGAPLVADALRAFALLAEVGLLALDPNAFHNEVKAKRLKALGLSEAAVTEKIAARTKARGAKDWKLADELRAELTDMKIDIFDRQDGVEWRVRLDQGS